MFKPRITDPANMFKTLCAPLAVPATLAALTLFLVSPLSTQTIAAPPPWSYDLDLDEVRTIDGTGNSIGGATHTQLKRIAPAAYPGDGSGDDIIEFPDRENPRVISNRIASQGSQSLPNARSLSDYLWAWGQFLDHDIDLTEAHVDNGIADVPVLEPNDPLGPNPILLYSVELRSLNRNSR